MNRVKTNRSKKFENLIMNIGKVFIVSALLIFSSANLPINTIFAAEEVTVLENGDRLIAWDKTDQKLRLSKDNVLFIPSVTINDPQGIHSATAESGLLSNTAVKVVFEGPVKISGYANGFLSNLKKVKNIENLHFLDTSDVSNMDYMFFALESLESIDLSTLNTNSATSMSKMFAQMFSIKELDLTSFNTSKVTDMQNMFEFNRSLNKLDISSFDSQNLSKTGFMFMENRELKEIVLGSKFQMKSNMELPGVAKKDPYTGKWQNVRTGSVSNPAGEYEWSSAQFMSNYKGGAQADTYVWQTLSNPVAAADLTVLYKDTEGNTIATDKKVSGNIGDTFDVTTSEFKLDITGYTFARIEGTPTGTLSDQAQTVTYVYTKLKEEIVQPVKPEELTTLPKTGVGNGVLMMGTVISTLGLILVGRKKED